MKSPLDNNAWKAERLNAIREFHANLIKDLGINSKDFNMKTPYYDDSKGCHIVAIYPSEFEKPAGFYFELVTFSLFPISEERKVYRLNPSNTYMKDYDLYVDNKRYAVPLDDLRVVNPASVAISGRSALLNVDRNRPTQPVFNHNEPPKKINDQPFTEMSIRDFYAIVNNTPISSKQWLNDLIKSNL